MINASKPFPIKSSMYFQKNCITSRKIEIQKVIAKGPTKDLTVNVYSFFNAVKTMKKENYCISRILKRVLTRQFDFPIATELLQSHPLQQNL